MSTSSVASRRTSATASARPVVFHWVVLFCVDRSELWHDLIVWMAGAGIAGIAGHRSAVETFDRLGYSPARRMAAAVAELLSATGVLLGAAFPDMAIGVSGTVAANFITGLTWFVIGNSDASHRDKIGGWAITILATGYLVILMIR